MGQVLHNTYDEATYRDEKKNKELLQNQKKVSIIIPVYNVENVVYHYRMRIGSSVNKASNEPFSVFENIEYLRRFLLEENLLEKLNKNFRKYVIHSLFTHYACIPEDSSDKYLDTASRLLTKKEYEKFLKKNEGNFSLIENIFSLKNKKRNGTKYKILRIFGVTFTIGKSLGEVK